VAKPAGANWRRAEPVLNAAGAECELVAVGVAIGRFTYPSASRPPVRGLGALWFCPTRLPARSGCDGTHDNPLEFDIEEIDQVELTRDPVEHPQARAVVPELRADRGLPEALGR
jgi:hypothetical protein